ncbi:asparaginase [Hyphomonas johnsonii MHS-2]|uniref:Asparaginase n=1 Tax=Hyphomonas johnsonii MHS-2 TaxID=1280950 RepID=A0A059FM07_9PROT|nr:asparaginase [Hyphomonas johnsonii MHS-2]
MLTTGGTIGSLLGDDEISIEASGETLKGRLGELAARVETDIAIYPVSNVASPNLEPEDWTAFSSQIATCRAQGIDRFVLTHGTDTLHYTAAFLSLQFQGHDVRVCITGAFFPINDPRSDTNANVVSAFQAATDDRIKDGVYAAFADRMTGDLAVVPGIDLMPPLYDEPAFRSVFDKAPDVTNTVDHADSLFNQINWPGPRSIITSAQLAHAKGRVAAGRLYPGMDMRIFQTLEKHATLILEGYHSGTGTARRLPTGIRALIETRPDLTICLASIPSPSVPVPYEASRILSDAGVRVYRDLPPHLLYVSALAGIAEGKSGPEALEMYRNYRI